MKKKTKELTNDELIKRYRGQYITLKVFTYIVLIFPMAILLGVNWQVYFPLDTDKGIINLSLSAGIALLCLALAIIQVAKKIERKEITLFFTSLYWLALAVISYLLAELFADITLICLCVGGGMLLSATLNMFAANRKRRMNSYIKGTAYARARKNEEREERKQVKKEKHKKQVESVE